MVQPPAASRHMGHKELDEPPRASNSAHNPAVKERWFLNRHLEKLDLQKENLLSLPDVDLFGVEHVYVEDASGLISVLVRGLVEDVVLPLAQQLARHLGGHHVHDLHVVCKDRLVPKHLRSETTKMH